jgi:hypothetical protein
VLVLTCSLVAVVWQLGTLPLIGFDLDPYSILVPFLVFAIGISHGAQKMNGVMQDIGRGNSNLIAARLTFRRLFLAGFTALICDAVGFAVLIVEFGHFPLLAGGAGGNSAAGAHLEFGAGADGVVGDWREGGDPAGDGTRGGDWGGLRVVMLTGLTLAAAVGTWAFPRSSFRRIWGFFWRSCFC